MTRSALFVVFVAASCGGGGGAAGTVDGGGDTSDGPSDQADAAPGAFSPLVMTSWTLPPGSERYRCARRTLTTAASVRAFRPVVPLGTHHSVLSLDDGSRPDGDTDCGPIAGARAIFMSGVSSPSFELPAGVAIRVPAGQQIVLNLHLYNTDGDKPLSGVSGVEIRTENDPQAVEAEVILAGPLGFTVQKGERELTFHCTNSGPVTIFAIAPHMHRLGTHMRVKRGDQTLLEVPYSFEEQKFHDVGPFSLPSGTTIDVTCGWNNDTGSPISFGDSSDDEMCFAVLYRYPVRPGGPFCMF